MTIKKKKVELAKKTRKIVYNLAHILLNFLWFFSKSGFGDSVLSFLFFLKLIEAKCKWMVLWTSWSAMIEFLILSFMLVSAIFYLLINIPNSRRYLVNSFGASFLREHLPDSQIVKKLAYAAGIACLVKICTSLIEFFASY